MVHQKIVTRKCAFTAESVSLIKVAPVIDNFLLHSSPKEMHYTTLIPRFFMVILDQGQCPQIMSSKGNVAFLSGKSVDLQPNTCLELIFELLSVVLERAKLSHISKCPGNADAYPDACEDPVDFFWSLPKLNGDAKYTRETTRLSDCRKEAYGQGNLTPKIFTLFSCTKFDMGFL